jgi:hypothetical protein
MRQRGCVRFRLIRNGLSDRPHLHWFITEGFAVAIRVGAALAATEEERPVGNKITCLSINVKLRLSLSCDHIPARRISTLQCLKALFAHCIVMYGSQE